MQYMSSMSYADTKKKDDNIFGNFCILSFSKVTRNKWILDDRKTGKVKKRNIKTVLIFNSFVFSFPKRYIIVGNIFLANSTALVKLLTDFFPKMKKMVYMTFLELLAVN